MRPAILVLVVSSVFAQAQAPPGETTEAARATEAAAVAKKAAEAYKVTTVEAGRNALQLEPKSLLHWPNPVLGSFHGSVFIRTANGRPEVVFLLIEARAGDKGPAWHYALARMNSVEFHVAHRGPEVWSAPVIPWSQARNPREPYTLIIFRPGEGVNPPELPPSRSGIGP